MKCIVVDVLAKKCQQINAVFSGQIIRARYIISKLYFLSTWHFSESSFYEVEFGCCYGFNESSIDILVCIYIGVPCKLGSFKLSPFFATYTCVVDCI